MIKELYPDDYDSIIKIEYIIEQFFIFRDIGTCKLNIDAKDLSYYEFNCFRYIEGVLAGWRATEKT